MSDQWGGPSKLGAFPDDELLDGRYRLESLIGRGAMGRVYRALDTRLDRPVAVKILLAAPSDNGGRFDSEVQTLARLAHPNLVRLLDAGESGGQLFLVMELIEGQTLAARLREGPLAPAQAASIGAGVAAALSSVHRSGIVHRDVKPANILIDEDGSARLTDFGIARLADTTGMTATGLVIGTPAYLAPEQILGESVGPPVDVYALGLVLLESLTGSRAFAGTTWEVTAARLHHDPPLAETLGPAWRSVLEAMTRREPSERMSAAEAAEVLRATASGSSTQGETGLLVPGDDTTIPLATAALEPTLLATEVMDPTAVAPLAAPGHPSRRRRVATVVGGLVAAICIGLVLAALWPTAKPPAGSTHLLAARASTTTSTTAPTTTSTSTTSTTTTLAPSPVASSVTSALGVIQQGATAGTIARPVAQQLTQGLATLTSAPAPAQLGQLSQLAQTYWQAVQNGQIAASAIRPVGNALGSVAGALGSSLPTQPTAPGPPPAHGHHGHGGDGQGNG